ncbi:hypothetical protein FACS1894208_00410 [Clostridia bacterium]|nr:hypothetical protein FACS1894208_00410 [Clostridia bacterium]
MKCTNCNAETTPGKKFCGYCGAKVEVARKCAQCGAVLSEGTVFCGDCGAKYAVETTPEMSGSRCANTIKGNVVTIEDTLYFVSKDKGKKGIYSVALRQLTAKARRVLGVENFLSKFSSDEYTGFGTLHAWNEKLYFYARFDCCGEDEALFGDCGSKGIFSFSPKINKLELIDETEGAYDDVRFSEGKAYYTQLNIKGSEILSKWREALEDKYGEGVIVERNGEGASFYWDNSHQVSTLVTLDLATEQKSETFFPIVAVKDWTEKLPGNNRILSDWDEFIAYGGYIYVSCKWNGYCSLRFPANEPRKYQLLKYGSFVRSGALFAVAGDVLVLGDLGTRQPVAYSLSTLSPIEGFGNEKQSSSSSWQVYGSYLVCQSQTAGRADVYSIPNAKYCGGTDERYVTMLDAICAGDKAYCIGEFYRAEGAAEGGEYSDLALYIIPLDKLFREDTYLDDYAQPLF